MTLPRCPSSPPIVGRPSAREADTWPALQRDTARDLWRFSAVLALISTGLAMFDGLAAGYAMKAIAIQVVVAAVVGCALRSAGATAHPHPRFGPANRVTLTRLTLATLLAALCGPAAGPPVALSLASDSVRWAVVAAATLAALLDAVDGPLARRSGLASAFGARFDMETDAWFTLVLCALVLQAGQAGPWVLASGLMRYAFVGAMRPWPWLAAPLPPSRRRQAVCVVQITALIVCLGPIVPPAWAHALAAASLALLTVSFAIDVHTLARARRHPLEV